MPVITLGIGQVNEDQKRQLVEKLTAEAAAITKMGVETFTVFIQEYPYENIGFGGKTVKDRKAGK